MRRNKQDKDEERRDQSRNVVKALKPGTIVYVLNEPRRDKFQPLYKGPFQIVSQDEHQAYNLRDSVTLQPFKRAVTIEKLKLADFPNEIPDSQFNADGEDDEQPYEFDEELQEQVKLTPARNQKSRSGRRIQQPNRLGGGW